MTLKSSPYISFPGNASEAFAFYHEVFGGDLKVMGYEGIDVPFEPPAGAVAHAELQAEGLSLTGGDAIGEDLPPVESGVYSLLLGPQTIEDGAALREKLMADGGTEAMPFGVAPWGDWYGQVKDKFGVLWQIAVAMPEQG